MRTALIITVDASSSLHPLTDEDMPIALLQLGDRRTVIQQVIDRWTDIEDRRLVWVLAAGRHRARLREELGERIHVAESDEVDGIGALRAALAEITSEFGSPTCVLVHPAESVVTEEASFLERVSAGSKQATTSHAGVSFTVEDGCGGLRSTGIQAWPMERLDERLKQASVDRALSIGDALGKLASELQTVPLEEGSWVDMTDWEGIRHALEHVEKPWGYERLWALNRHYAGKVLFIAAGESLSLQYHEQKDETIRIVSGRMRFRLGTSRDTLETLILEPGMSRAIPPGMVHQMEALQDCTVVEVSTPHLMDVVRLDDRYGRE